MVSLCALPKVHAAPTSSTESLRYPANWFNGMSFGQSLAWASPSIVALLLDYTGHRMAKRDSSWYSAFSCGASVASLVFLDARTPAEIRWPTLLVASDFFLHHWLSLANRHGMGLGYLATAIGMGISTDTFLVHFASGLQGDGQGLFPQLLLICFWLALFVCSSVAQVLGRGRSARGLNEDSEAQLALDTLDSVPQTVSVDSESSI